MAISTSPQIVKSLLKFNQNSQFLQFRLNLVEQIIGKYGFIERKHSNQESNLCRFQGQQFLGKNKVNKK